MNYEWITNTIAEGRLEWLLGLSVEELLTVGLLVLLAAFGGTIVTRLNHVGHGGRGPSTVEHSDDTEYRKAA